MLTSLDEQTVNESVDVSHIARRALRALYEVCDGARSQDNLGLTASEARSPFLADMRDREEPYTPNQLKALMKVLTYHRKQLEDREIPIPDIKQCDTYYQSYEQKKPARPKVGRKIDIVGSKLQLQFDYGDDFNLFSDFKQVLYQRGIRCLFVKTTQPPYWEMPHTETTFRTLTSSKYFEMSEYGAEAAEYKAFLAQQDLERDSEALAAKIQAEREYKELLASYDLRAEFAPGQRLYPHQIEAIEWMLARRRCIIGDDRGLGKTYTGLVAAKILHQKFGWKIWVITTASMEDDWRKAATTMQVPVEIFSWGKMPVLHAEDDEDFILVGDEAHKGKTFDGKTSQQMMHLSLHKQCKAVFLLTGTPTPNGRPAELFPLLMCCKHPLAYSDESPYALKKLKRDYERNFCDAKATRFTPWDISGASNLKVLYKHIRHNFGDTYNGPDACLILRKKTDHLDLPPKNRVLRPVEIDSKIETEFWDAFNKLWEQFQANIKAKIEAFTAKSWEENHAPPKPYELEAEMIKIKQAEAVVAAGHFRHAGAVAKTQYAVDLAVDLAGEEGEQVILFTSFRDVAAQLVDEIKKKTGEDARAITGETSKKNRDMNKEDFQSGKYRFLVCTQAAGEGLTLTKARNMVVVDRPWTPGAILQWEDRIHRISQSQQVFIFWLQLPASLTDADIHVDEILQVKENNSSLALEGKAGSFSFVKENVLALRVLDSTHNNRHAHKSAKK